MGIQVLSIASAVLSSLAAAGASFFLKRGGTETRLSLRQLHIDRRVIVSIVLYILSSLFFILALGGLQLSVLLPLGTLEYVWILLLAKKFLHEKIGGEKSVGVGFIALGIILVGIGS